MLRYYDLGITTLLLKGFDPLPDAIEFGKKLLPLVRPGGRQAGHGRRALSTPDPEPEGRLTRTFVGGETLDEEVGRRQEAGQHQALPPRVTGHPTAQTHEQREENQNLACVRS